ncbi:unnamed protein product, partial [Schistosoma turkestanicum]
KSYPIDWKMEFMILSYLNISTMMIWAFGAMSKENKYSVCNSTNACIFNATAWSDLPRIYGVILIGMALIMALIIILLKALHTASTLNNIIMFITSIDMIVGYGLLTGFGDDYQQVIAPIVPVATLIFAIISGLRMKGSSGKLRLCMQFCLQFFGSFQCSSWLH